jgi:transcriptional regulator GlxA family with amidase domain
MVCQACRDNARDLLRRNDKIAYAVGFSSQRHLTANFRRTFRRSLVSANVR